MDLVREYTIDALDALRAHLGKLPPDVRRKVELAISVINSHGMATSEELRQELGDNWVIARRTPRIVEKYGTDVNCVSLREYAAAERRAIERRVKHA